MKNRSLVVAVFSLFIMLLSCKEQADLASEKSEVTKTIKEFYRSFEQEDMDLMSNLMAHDESMLSFGTSLEDHHNSWTEWKTNHLAQFEAIDKAKINSKTLEVYMSQSGTVAWFANVTDWSLVVQNEAIDIPSVRITGVLEKRNEDWKIVQIHASVPQS